MGQAHEDAHGRGPVISRRAAVTALGAAVGGLATVPTLLASSPAAAATGDAQLLVGTTRPELVHTIRFANGSWFPLPPGATGGMTTLDLACALRGGELHYVQVDNVNARLWHGIRRGDGTWLGPNDVAPFAGSVPEGPTSVAAAFLADGLHVLVGSTSGLWYSVRRDSDGLWSTWRRPEPVWAIGVQRVAAAASGNGELHVAFTDRGGVVYHRVRRTNGVWTPNIPLDGRPGYVSDVAMAEAGSWMHVAISVRSPNGGFSVWHRVRFRDGTWLPFGERGSATPAADRLGAAGFANGEFHLAVASSVDVFHTVRRYPSGIWTTWGQVADLRGRFITRIDLAGQQ